MDSVVIDVYNTVVHELEIKAVDEQNHEEIRCYIEVERSSLCYQKPIAASSIWSDENGVPFENCLPDKMVDDQPNTNWSAKEGSGAGEWFVIDLEKPLTFSQVVIKQNRLANRIAGFALSVSNDQKNWTLVYQYGDGPLGIAKRTFLLESPITSRFVKFQVIKTQMDNGYSCPSIDCFELH